ncbi:unnamed protein product, partial [Heterotrigona itama]
ILITESISYRKYTDIWTLRFKKIEYELKKGEKRKKLLRQNDVSFKW